MTENEIKWNLDGVIKYLYKKNELGGDDSEKQYQVDNSTIDLLEELQQYRATGTLEECREARERQRGKKPILDTIYHQQYYCPNCEDFLSRKNGNKPNHCIYGQAIDWSDNT